MSREADEPCSVVRCGRVDLHCHSDASVKAAEVVLSAIRCPECFSRPDEVYAQAIRRGMNFVTLTDHDAIDGALRIAHLPGVLVGEELTCFFPEDRCKMHVLVWGLDRSDHNALQQRAADIYQVAEYLERRQLAHAVAHPIYRQNDKLERWHIERLFLLFKGFECLNGAHSPLHREAFEPLLDQLTPEHIQHLAQRHHIAPRWPEPWIKSRTGGSDDHGLLNVGRTWTEFPPDVTTVADVLRFLREGRCRPGGESGSSIKLAHTFYSVAVRYYNRELLGRARRANLITALVQKLVGERSVSRGRLTWLAVRHRLTRWMRGLTHVLRGSAHSSGTAAILRRYFLTSARRHLDEYPALSEAMKHGLPPLGEHEQMFRLATAVNRDVLDGIADEFVAALRTPRFWGLFDAIGAALAQQFVLLPYYFAVFHQNKERHLLRRLTGIQRPITQQSLRVGLFTDTLDEVNGVGRFVRDMAHQAQCAGRHLTIHTCCASPRFELPNRRNFAPVFARALPYYPELSLNLPPILEILDWADQQQFDAVHLSTPGPMGLCGYLVARMLRVPVLGTYHTDFPAYVEQLTRDHRITRATVAYMRWFYTHMAGVFTRSHHYRACLRDLDVGPQRIRGIQPGVDTQRFNPARGQQDTWQRYGIERPHRLLYAGRVSVEKNLPMLVDVFRRLCAARDDVALLVAGDGPYRQEMQSALAGLPAVYPGYRDDSELAALYCGADLLVFPSRTDTLGQVVMEAQACGLPALVSNEGGPKELVQDGISGLVLPGTDPQRWHNAIDALLDDESRRMRFARAAIQRSTRFSLEQTFAAFWSDHVQIVRQVSGQSDEPLEPDRRPQTHAKTGETPELTGKG